MADDAPRGLLADEKDDDDGGDVVRCDDGLEDRGRTLLGGDMNSGGMPCCDPAPPLAWLLL